jgi:hypothetical protein
MFCHFACPTTFSDRRIQPHEKKGGMRMNQTPIGSTLRFQAKPNYVLREIAGEHLLIPISLERDEQSQIAILSEGGKFLWNKLQQEHSIAELTEAMTEEYDVSAETAHSDILEFVNQLQKNLLLIMEEE